MLHGTRFTSHRFCRCTTELADDEAHDVGLGLSQPRDTSTGLLDMKRDVKKSDFGSNVQCRDYGYSSC